MSLWETESADEMRQRLQEEMLRRQTQANHTFQYRPDLHGAYVHDNGSGAMDREKYYAKLMGDVRQKQRAQMEDTIKKLFQNIIDQINQVEVDFKKFNSEWDVEGRAACVTYRVLQEHIQTARQGVEIARATCLYLSKP